MEFGAGFTLVPRAVARHTGLRSTSLAGTDIRLSQDRFRFRFLEQAANLGTLGRRFYWDLRLVDLSSPASRCETPAPARCRVSDMLTLELDEPLLRQLSPQEKR